MWHDRSDKVARYGPLIKGSSSIGYISQLLWERFCSINCVVKNNTHEKINNELHGKYRLLYINGVCFRPSKNIKCLFSDFIMNKHLIEQLSMPAMLHHTYNSCITTMKFFDENHFTHCIVDIITF